MEQPEISESQRELMHMLRILLPRFMHSTLDWSKYKHPPIHQAILPCLFIYFAQELRWYGTYKDFMRVQRIQAKFHKRIGDVYKITDNRKRKATGNGENEPAAKKANDGEGGSQATAETADTTDTDPPIVLPVFKYGNAKFIFEKDVYSALNLPLKEGPPGMTLTIEAPPDNEPLVVDGVAVRYEAFNVEIPKTKFRGTMIRTVRTDATRSVQVSAVILEILDEWIFGNQLFQKIKEQGEWSKIDSFFESVKSHIDLDREGIYLLVDQTADSVVRAAMNYFPELMNRPAKSLRNPEKKGFDLQFLRDEVQNMGLHEAFPDIFNHVEYVFTEVFKAKHEAELRVCDLYEMIRQLVLISFFKQFPELLFFMHKQHECHNILVTKCCNPQLCELSVIDLSEVNVEAEDVIKYNKPMVGLILDKERTVNYNHLMYRKVLKTHFLVTMRSHFPKGLYVPDIVEERIESDFPVNWELLLTDNSMTSYFVREGEEAKAQELGFEWSDSLSSKVNTVEHLTKGLFPVPFYLRTFSFDICQRKETKRIFADEAIKLLEVLLSRQEVSPVNMQKLSEYKTQWLSGENIDSKTITISQLTDTLDDLQIKKEQITLAPDPLFTYTLREVQLCPGAKCILTLSPSKKPLIDASQLVFYIFQTVICDINWEKRPADMVGLACDFRRDIIKRMELIIRNNDFTEYQDRYKIVNELRNHEFYKRTISQNIFTPLAKIDGCKQDERIDFSFFASECAAEHLDISKFIPNTFERDWTLPVWKVRIVWMLAWIEMFFGSRSPELQDILRKAVFFKVPVRRIFSFTNHYEQLLSVMKRPSSSEKASKEFKGSQDPSNAEGLEQETRIYEDQSFLNRMTRWEKPEFDESQDLSQQQKAFRESFDEMEKKKNEAFGTILSDWWKSSKKLPAPEDVGAASPKSLEPEGLRAEHDSDEESHDVTSEDA